MITSSIQSFATCLQAPLILALAVGCNSRYRDDLDYSYEVQQSWEATDLVDGTITQFRSVPFDPIRIASISDSIKEDQIAAGRDVLLIGSSTGVIPILCLLNEASEVTAIDPVPASVANTRYNAAVLAADFDCIVRLHPSQKDDVFASLESKDQFDLILVDGDRKPFVSKHVNATGLSPKQSSYRSLLQGLRQRLNTGGRCIVYTSLASGGDFLIEAANEAGVASKMIVEKSGSSDTTQDNGDNELAATPANRLITAELIELRVTTYSESTAVKQDTSATHSDAESKDDSDKKARIEGTVDEPAADSD